MKKVLHEYVTVKVPKEAKTIIDGLIVEAKKINPRIRMADLWLEAANLLAEKGNSCPHCDRNIGKLREWSTSESNIVKSNTHMTAEQLAAKLGRTVASIYTFCQRNNIKLTNKRAKVV